MSVITILMSHRVSIWSELKMVMDITTTLQERDFANNPYVPVYVMLPLGIINSKSELVDLDSLLNQLRTLKSINVDGVMVDCWWGIVEAHAPQEYNWSYCRSMSAEAILEMMSAFLCLIG